MINCAINAVFTKLIAQPP